MPCEFTLSREYCIDCFHQLTILFLLESCCRVKSKIFTTETEFCFNRRKIYLIFGIIVFFMAWVGGRGRVFKVIRAIETWPGRIGTIAVYFMKTTLRRLGWLKWSKSLQKCIELYRNHCSFCDDHFCCQIIVIGYSPDLSSPPFCKNRVIESLRFTPKILLFFRIAAKCLRRSEWSGQLQWDPDISNLIGNRKLVPES